MQSKEKELRKEDIEKYKIIGKMISVLSGILMFIAILMLGLNSGYINALELFIALFVGTMIIVTGWNISEDIGNSENIKVERGDK